MVCAELCVLNVGWGEGVVRVRRGAGYVTPSWMEESGNVKGRLNVFAWVSFSLVVVSADMVFRCPGWGG